MPNSGYAFRSEKGRLKRTIRLSRRAVALIVLPALGILLVWAAFQASAARYRPTDPRINASLHGRRLFPPDNPWNQAIDTQPVDFRSAVLLGTLGLDTPLHADFGVDWKGKPFGIPYMVVGDEAPRMRLSFDYADQSDPGPYPLPLNAPIEPGDDHHILIIDQPHWKLYELWEASPTEAHAGSGAIFDLSSNAPRPAGWTSADAAGLPVLPGLARYDEVEERKEITHALRFTAARTRRAYIPPARHFASHLTDALLPPLGMRVRLKAGYDISAFPPEAQVVLRALKKYGMILADNGKNWYVSGTADSRWHYREFKSLERVTGRDFEVVAMGRPVTE